MTEPVRRRPSAAVVLASLSLVVSLGGTAVAATGGTFLLGKANEADKTTKLKTSGDFDKATLEVKNRGDGAAATFKTSGGVPPFAVNQDDKVANLNADLLDGLGSSAFLPAGTPVLRSDATPMTVVVHGTTGQPVASGGGPAMVAAVEDYDPSGMFDVSDDPTVLRAPRAGTYLVSASVTWASAASGYVATRLRTVSSGLAFATVLGPNIVPAGAEQSVTGIVHLAAGEGVDVLVGQSSGASLNALLSTFRMTYVGP